jgi:uncharacterized protein
MLIENTFKVTSPADPLWRYLLDVEKIAPCMPGAELTEIVDDRHWKGKLKAKFGPVGLSFAGTVEMTERDDAAHRVSLTAKGMEQKGKGAANANVTSWLEPGPASHETTVKMEAEITLTGAAAQLSRGLLPEISKKLTQQFADCLQANMAAGAASGSTEASDAPTQATATRGSAAAAPDAVASSSSHAPSRPAPAAAAKPVGGIGLGLSALWSVVKAFFARLFGRAPKA